MPKQQRHRQVNGDKCPHRGLSWLLLLIFLLLAVTLLASAIDLGDSLGALMFPLMLLVAAMFFCSLFFTYRDTFEATEVLLA